MSRATAAKDSAKFGDPMFPHIAYYPNCLHKNNYQNYDIVLQLTGIHRTRIPFEPKFTALRVRKSLGRNEIATLDLPGGTQIIQVPMHRLNHFNSQVAIRKSLDLGKAKPGTKVAIDIRRLATKRIGMQEAIYSSMVYLAPMMLGPNIKKRQLKSTINAFGVVGKKMFLVAHASAHANILSRLLGNMLKPATLIAYCKDQAQLHGLEFEFMDTAALTKSGASAFVAGVGPHSKGGLIRLSYRSKKARSYIALVGKGSFATNDPKNKKTQRTASMHEGLSGAAAALSALIAAVQLKLKINVDIWLAVTEKFADSKTLKPGDIVTSHLGPTIKLMHINAVDKLLLADSLSIASQNKPDAIATLVNSDTVNSTISIPMSEVTGDKYLVKEALRASKESGEQLRSFSLPAKSANQLATPTAAIVLDTANDKTNHNLAAPFLAHFNRGVPWLHLDLAITTNAGGLGAVPTDQTGFGAHWAVKWLLALAR